MNRSRFPVLVPMLATTLAATTPALACEAPIGPIETCMVGAWIGSATIPQALETMMRNMPGTVAANFSSFGQPMAIIIYDTGFFETFPTGVEGWVLREHADGEIAQMEMNLQTTTAAGYLSALGGSLQMCHLSELGQAVGQVSVTTSDGSATAPLFSPPGPPGFMPAMSYSCTGNAMQMVVNLPEPVGAITYNMARIPDAAFPDELRTRIDERYAPADPLPE